MGQRGGRGGKRVGAGAPRGQRPATIAREIVADVVYEEIQKRNANQKRGIDIINVQMMMWLGIAARLQRDYPENFHTMREFRYATERAERAAAELAKYQTPRFKSVAVREPPPLPKVPQNDATPTPGEKPGNVVSMLKKRTPQEIADLYARKVRGG